MDRDWKECINCPEILTEKYGKGEDKCAECVAEEKKEKEKECDTP